MAETIDNADRLTADALHLAISLDSFTTLDWVERIGPAVRRGSQELAGLERRRALLNVRRCDDAIIDWMLETIDARLKFLQSLLAPKMQNQERRPPTRAEQPSGSFAEISVAANATPSNTSHYRGIQSDVSPKW
jgi:hypothetical protein